MTASRDWTTYEAKPAGADFISVGDDEIRATKVDIRERMAIDHLWGDSTATDGQHIQMTTKASAIDPTNIAGYGIVYTKDIGAGVIELFYEDAAANKIQITAAGALNPALLPSIPTILADVYPVGCIYTTTTSTNPATVFGFGTWAAFGSGRVLVGLNGADTDFDVVEETGGAKTINIAHTHTVPASSSTSWGPGGAQVNNGRLGLGSSENKEASADVATSSGLSTTQTIVQPYIVVYFFKRTA